MDMSRFNLLLSILFVVGCVRGVRADEAKGTTVAAPPTPRDLTNLYPDKDRSEKAVTEPAKFVSQDEVIELTDLRLVLRKVSFDKSIDGNDFIFFSETEVSNRMFAAYLTETNQIRDDSELKRATRERTEVFSTAAPAIRIGDRTALWRNGKMPEDREDHPVSFITTHQTVKFCEWLNSRYDVPGVFRLPTEDEWLFAAYGSDREFPWGDDKKKWIGKSTEPVNAHPELRTPDGLYSMWGNVSELILSTSDGYGGQIKDKYDPWICQWLGTSFKEEVIQGKGAQPRQDYWGYTHSLRSRSDEWGFRFVFVPKTTATSDDETSTEAKP